MKEYKRITRRTPERNIPFLKYGINGREAINRLAELEDKIESGNLVELPFKAGDIVYVPWYWDGDYGIMEAPVTRFAVDYKNVIAFLDTDDYNFYEEHHMFALSEFGTRVFTDKSEAERKLAELKGETDK